MVVIDATFLLLMLRPETPVPTGPNGLQIDSARERIDHLVYELDKARTKIIIPTPAFSEAMVRAGAAASQQIADYLQRYSAFQIQPFDTLAAIEVAAMARGIRETTGKKKGDSTATWAKVKYDRQIVAIAKVCGATTIYSDDGDIASLGKQANIAVVGLASLPLPPPKTPDLFTLPGQQTAGTPGAKDDKEPDDKPKG